MAALSFDWLNRVITVLAPDTEILMQDLINQIRDEEDELVNHDRPIIAAAAGKDVLDLGVQIGITLTLINNWQLAFEARPGPAFVQCVVKGGNLVGGLAGNPIKVTAYTQVKLLMSAASTLTGSGSPAEVADAVWAAASALRLLGMVRENSFTDNTAFDGNNQLTACRLRVFDTKAHAEAATDGGSETLGLIATYAVTAEYEAVGKLKQHRMVLV